MLAKMQADFDTLYEAGLTKLQAGNSAGEQDLIAAAKLDPERWFNLGSNLSNSHPEQALGIFSDLLRICRDKGIRAGVLNNIGKIFCGVSNFTAAEDAFNHARELNPLCPSSYINLALVQKWQLNLAKAKQWIDEAIRLNPWHNQAQFTQAMISLLSGDYEHGFPQYECRWRDKTNGIRKIIFDKPEWDGTNGSRLYVYGEQGTGDTILMLRYARMIKATGVQQAWVGQKGMKSLIQSVPEIDEAVDGGDSLPDFDCHIPAASLPCLFNTTMSNIPAAPYIPRPVVEPLSGFNVGICWRGASSQANDAFRSTSLADWQSVFDIPGITFHSLQVDHADEGLFYPLVQHPKPESYLDTAKLMCRMNLIITVDTSVMHLAGAMGLPTWCAMHRRPYFVFPVNREDTPWYSSVRLFKAEKDKCWLPVFERIAAELKKLPLTN